MKVGLPTFMLTTDEPVMVQKYRHENGAAVSYENQNSTTKNFHHVCLWHASIMSVFMLTKTVPKESLPVTRNFLFNYPSFHLA